jgi:hypothetical protein
MSRKVLHCIVPSCVLFFLPLLVSAQTPNTTSRVQTKQPQTQSKPLQPAVKVPMAAWSEGAGTLIGLTKAAFDSMGLEKLTPSEYATFESWVYTRETDADTAARASQLTYSCGRSSKEAHDWEKVNIYLMIQDSTPSELASRIRHDLRAINDVQIVFSGEDADLIVNIVGFSIETTLGQKTGYAASIVTSDPCVGKIGGQQSKFAMLENAYLQTSGTDAVKLAEGVTTTLDSKDIESARNNNAAIIQLLKNNKK